MVCREKALRYETPTQSPPAGAESLSINVCLQASFLGLCNCLWHSSLSAVLKQGPVSMELVCEQRTVVDGKAFWIGWRMVREKGWHTYWEHPGDVGVPPRIKWSLPDGIRAGELLYSPPQRVKMGKVGAHGNYGETLFLCRFDPIVRSSRKRRQNNGKSVLVGVLPSADPALPICLSKSVASRI